MPEDSQRNTDKPTLKFFNTKNVCHEKTLIRIVIGYANNNLTAVACIGNLVR